MQNEIQKDVENKVAPHRETVVLKPQVDIIEDDSQVLLIADMPGVNEKNVDIDLQGNNLTIRGQREPASYEGMTLKCAEYQPDFRYERQFTLGETIDVEHIGATMKDGVLKLSLPKVKEAAPRRIEVKLG